MRIVRGLVNIALAAPVFAQKSPDGTDKVNSTTSGNQDNMPTSDPVLISYSVTRSGLSVSEVTSKPEVPSGPGLPSTFGLSTGAPVIEYTTVTVDTYTTFCPTATKITQGTQTYTAKASETITVTNCPCTRVTPIGTIARFLPTAGASSIPEFPGYGIVPSPTGKVNGSGRGRVFVATAPTIPVFTPSLLGNAYGGGKVTSPSVYVTKLPFPNGPSAGIPPGYGFSLKPGMSSSSGNGSVLAFSKGGNATIPPLATGTSTVLPNGSYTSMIHGVPSTMTLHPVVIKQSGRSEMTALTPVASRTDLTATFPILGSSPLLFPPSNVLTSGPSATSTASTLVSLATPLSIAGITSIVTGPSGTFVVVIAPAKSQGESLDINTIGSGHATFLPIEVHTSTLLGGSLQVQSLNPTVAASATVIFGETTLSKILRPSATGGIANQISSAINNVANGFGLGATSPVTATSAANITNVRQQEVSTPELAGIASSGGSQTSSSAITGHGSSVVAESGVSPFGAILSTTSVSNLSVPAPNEASITPVSGALATVGSQSSNPSSSIALTVISQTIGIPGSSASTFLEASLLSEASGAIYTSQAAITGSPSLFVTSIAGQPGRFAAFVAPTHANIAITTSLANGSPVVVEIFGLPPSTQASTIAPGTTLVIGGSNGEASVPITSTASSLATPTNGAPIVTGALVVTSSKSVSSDSMAIAGSASSTTTGSLSKYPSATTGPATPASPLMMGAVSSIPGASILASTNAQLTTAQATFSSPASGLTTMPVIGVPGLSSVIIGSTIGHTATSSRAINGSSSSAATSLPSVFIPSMLLSAGPPNFIPSASTAGGITGVSIGNSSVVVHLSPTALHFEGTATHLTFSLALGFLCFFVPFFLL